MKVGVNIDCLRPPLTGIGHYARHLIRRLLADPAVESVAGVSRAGWHTREEVSEIVAHARGYGVPKSLSRRVRRRVPGVGRLGAKVDCLLRRRRFRRFADHLYWEPNYLLLPLDNPALVTVHDLSHLRHPEFHPERRLRELERLGDSIARAGAVAVVSEFSRREVADLFGLGEDRIALVPPAVGARFFPRPAEASSELRRRYRLPERFVLFVGTMEPRKNLPRLLRAFSRLPQSLRENCPLVLAGGDGWRTGEFDRVLGSLEPGLVRRLGYVGREDLPGLYSAATAFAYPSLYEGFGMPVLEAMASGTPVLTSSVSAMPEVAGGAARLVDPRAVDDIVDGLRELLEDAGGRASMAAAGLRVAARHSWERSYRRLHTALRALAA